MKEITLHFIHLSPGQCIRPGLRTRPLWEPVTENSWWPPRQPPQKTEPEFPGGATRARQEESIEGASPPHSGDLGTRRFGLVSQGTGPKANLQDSCLSPRPPGAGAESLTPQGAVSCTESVNYANLYLILQKRKRLSHRALIKLETNVSIKMYLFPADHKLLRAGTFH